MEVELKGSYYAKAYYKGDGATRQFAVPFPYIAKSHVTVFVEGYRTSYDWNDNGTITLFGSAPSEGERIEVRRITPRDECIVQYSDYHALTADMLNMQDLQFLFLFQEDLDYLVDVAIGNIGGGGGGDDPSDGGGTGGGGSGSTLPPVAVDLSKLREEILKQILAELDKSKKEMDEFLKGADERIRAGLDRLQKELKDRFVDAGIIVDPDTGTIVFQVIEDLKTQTGHRFNDVWEKLDAHEAALSMGASSIIAEELLKRISNVELALDAMNASIDLRVTQVTEELKSNISKELKEASLDLDAKLGEIHLEVKRLYIDGLEERLSKAELYLKANGAELGGIVYDFKNILDKIDELNTGIVSNGQSIQDAQQARRDAVAALRQELALAKEALYAKIEENGNAVAAKTLQLLTSKEETIIAGYQNDIKAVSNSLKAEINAVSQAQSQFNNNIAAVRQEVQTLANKTTTGAKYGVYLDVNGYVSGVSMNNDSKKSDFTVVADNFYIRNPYRGTTVKPFYYNSSTGTLSLNGIKVDWADILNARIDAANISNLKVTKAQIQNLTIGTGDIANGSITTEKISNGAISSVWWYSWEYMYSDLPYKTASGYMTPSLVSGYSFNSYQAYAGQKILAVVSIQASAQPKASWTGRTSARIGAFFTEGNPSSVTNVNDKRLLESKYMNVSEQRTTASSNTYGPEQTVTLVLSHDIPTSGSFAVKFGGYSYADTLPTWRILTCHMLIFLLRR